MNNDLPIDAVERVRAIRNRHHEETKHMTIEEMWDYDQKRIDKFETLMKEVNPSDYDFSWLRRK